MEVRVLFGALTKARVCGAFVVLRLLPGRGATFRGPGRSIPGRHTAVAVIRAAVKLEVPGLAARSRHLTVCAFVPRTLATRCPLRRLDASCAHSGTRFPAPSTLTSTSRGCSAHLRCTQLAAIDATRTVGGELAAERVVRAPTRAPGSHSAQLVSRYAVVMRTAHQPAANDLASQAHPPDDPRAAARLDALAAALMLGHAPDAGAVSRAGPVIGVGEQKPVMFDSKPWRALRLRAARYTAPWDALRDPQQLALLDAWMASARRSRVRVLLGFAHSLRTQQLATKVPTPRQFEREFKRFRARYPWVRDWLVWNEANHPGSPTAKRPRRAAQLFDVVARTVAAATSWPPTSSTRPTWPRG